MQITVLYTCTYIILYINYNSMTLIIIKECVFFAKAASKQGLKFLVLFFFWLFRAAPVAYGGSQARGPVRATAVGLHHSHSHSHVGSELHLRPTTAHQRQMLKPLSRSVFLTPAPSSLAQWSDGKSTQRKWNPSVRGGPDLSPA